MRLICLNETTNERYKRANIHAFVQSQEKRLMTEYAEQLARERTEEEAEEEGEAGDDYCMGRSCEDAAAAGKTSSSEGEAKRDLLSAGATCWPNIDTPDDMQFSTSAAAATASTVTASLRNRNTDAAHSTSGGKKKKIPSNFMHTVEFQRSADPNIIENHRPFFTLVRYFLYK